MEIEKVEYDVNLETMIINIFVYYFGFRGLLKIVLWFSGRVYFTHLSKTIHKNLKGSTVGSAQDHLILKIYPFLLTIEEYTDIFRLFGRNKVTSVSTQNSIPTQINDAQSHFMKNFTPETYIEGLQKIGWLDRLSKKERTKLEKDIHAQAKLGTDDSMCWNLASLWFDAETIYETGPKYPSSSYYGMLKKFAKASRGNFQPTHIIDTHDAETLLFTVGFSMNNKKYLVSVDSSDYFDPKVMDLINKALTDAGVEEQFIDMPTGDQTMRVAFITRNIYAQSVQLGLIPGESSGSF